MMKKEKGITLVSLAIVVALMTIIASTVVNLSLNRFEINRLRKMYTDIELLQDKVANYYLKYETLPVLKNSSNTSVQYTYSSLNFEKNGEDNNIYYILDLSAMEGISLNYGKAGFNAPNTSEDVYIINEKSHIIYYVKGKKLNETTYYTLANNISISDTIPPSSPEIKVVSGTKSDNIYTTKVEVEIIAGKDGGSGVGGTKYSLDDGNNWDKFDGSSKIISLTENGEYKIIAATYDNATSLNYSGRANKTIIVHINHEWTLVSSTAATCTEEGIKKYKCNYCEETLEETEGALGHIEVIDKAVSATCTTTGKTEGSHCSRCNTVLKEQKVTEAWGHLCTTGGTVTIEATCTEKGTRKLDCDRCSETWYEDIEPTGHNWESGELNPAPTCTTVGRAVRTCLDCGTVETVYYPALGHEWKIIQTYTGDTWNFTTWQCQSCYEVKHTGTANEQNYTILYAYKGLCQCGGDNGQKETFINLRVRYETSGTEGDIYKNISFEEEERNGCDFTDMYIDITEESHTKVSYCKYCMSGYYASSEYALNATDGPVTESHTLVNGKCKCGYAP